MTIKQIENWLNLLRSEYCAKYNVEAEEANEAVKAAIEALERQIPKKPKYGRQGPDDYVICPQCGFLGLDEFQPCCSECGQHIDWPVQEVAE